MIYIDKKIITSDELKLLRWIEGNSFKKRLSYQIKKWQFFKIRKGLYVIWNISDLKEKDFLTIANSIYKPSYISFETVLREEWLIYQHYDSIFVASNYKKELQILNQNIQFKKLPQDLLVNMEWINNEKGYYIASPERAVLDTLFLNNNYYFDSFEWLNKYKLKDLAKIYKSHKKNIDDIVLKITKNL